LAEHVFVDIFQSFNSIRNKNCKPFY